MKQTELIAKAERGERITKAEAPCSLFVAPVEIGAHTCRWRDIVCDGDQDVVECAHCGRQRVCGCTFDDDYS
jgi:hypothetical protein